MDSIRALSCCSCGGSIEVPLDVRRLSCRWCGSMLEVEESHGAWFTREIEKLDHRTTQLERRVRSLEVRNRVRNVARYMVRRRYSDPASDDLSPSAQRDLGLLLLLGGLLLGGGLFLGGELETPGLFLVAVALLGGGGWNLVAGIRSMASDASVEAWRRKRRQKIARKAIGRSRR